MKREEKFKFIIDYFENNNPNAETELMYSNPYELLVAVILSAQCTDKRVNLITPAFFEKFPTVQVLAKFSPEEIFPYIKSISYPNNKAKHLNGMAKMLIEKFSSHVPEQIEDLIQLPGVGRKTANVIASVVYDKPAMAVDTHVFRVSARLGLSRNAKTPLETEKQLVKYIPKNKIARAHHWLILHGRYLCTARNPNCISCPFQDICLFFKTRSKPKVKK
jgi:endonuclease-3